jgi:HEXXH motif-containing protein
MAYHALANVQLLFEAVRSNEANDKWDIEYVRVNEPDLQAAIRALDQPLRGNPALTKLGRRLYDLLTERMAELMEMTVPRALASGS